MKKRKLYVWSGTLRGVGVVARSPDEAVVKAVKANLPCVVHNVIRVSLKPKGPHPYDVFIEAPYEERFPGLFDGDLEVQVAYVEEEG